MDPKLRAALSGYLLNKAGASPEHAKTVIDEVEANPHLRVSQLVLDSARQYQMEQLAQQEKLRMSLMSGGASGDTTARLLADAGYDDDRPDAVTSADAEVPALQRIGKRASKENAAVAKNPANWDRLKDAQDAALAYTNLRGLQAPQQYQSAPPGFVPAGQDQAGAAPLPEYGRPGDGQFLTASLPVAQQLSTTLGIDPALAADTAAKLYAPMQNDYKFAHYSDRGSNY